MSFQKAFEENSKQSGHRTLHPLRQSCRFFIPRRWLETRCYVEWSAIGCLDPSLFVFGRYNARTFHSGRLLNELVEHQGGCFILPVNRRLVKTTEIDVEGKEECKEQKQAE